MSKRVGLRHVSTVGKRSHIFFEPDAEEGLKWGYFSHEYIYFGEPEGSEFGGAYFSNQFIMFGEPQGDQFGGAYFNV